MAHRGLNEVLRDKAGLRDAGFSLLEALIAVAISAALLGLVIEVLSADAVQGRRFVSRSEAAVELAQGRRAFTAAASSLRGSGTSRAAGLLRIEAGRLVVMRGARVETIWRWQQGEAALAYSRDGNQWRSESSDLAGDSIRFSWRDGAREEVWMAP